MSVRTYESAYGLRTIREIRDHVASPGLQSIVEAPSVSWRSRPIPNLQGVAEIIEDRTTAVRLTWISQFAIHLNVFPMSSTHRKILPVPNRISQRAGNIIEVGNILHPELRLEGGLLLGRAECECCVYVRDHGFDVCCAVLRHVLPDGLEVAPLSD